MNFAEVVKQLGPKELEILMEKAYSDEMGGPFIVENVRVIGGMKEVEIRFTDSNVRRTVEVASGQGVNESG